ncbi:hypothetical protein PIB30_073643 [Stylosanthes scabra]|uniref:Uncharacterized protein n=1 Tax=Stylosanthes scabra TaxID=79078 RepID=A0ABU6RQM2_9FABA|nr:hypothetical protein [Stylosanthes scabra]
MEPPPETGLEEAFVNGGGVVEDQCHRLNPRRLAQHTISLQPRPELSALTVAMDTEKLGKGRRNSPEEAHFHAFTLHRLSSHSSLSLSRSLTSLYHQHQLPTSILKPTTDAPPSAFSPPHSHAHTSHHNAPPSASHHPSQRRAAKPLPSQQCRAPASTASCSQKRRTAVPEASCRHPISAVLPAARQSHHGPTSDYGTCGTHFA